MTEIHNITCLECEATHPYEFSKEEVKNYGIPPLENIPHGGIISGIIPSIICKSCGKRIQVPNFKPHNKL